MLPDRVEAFIRSNGLLVPGASVLVGVSGGLDSMVLLYLLYEGGYSVTAAHVNYGRRGAASDEDEALVREWCSALDIPVVVKRATPAELNEGAGQSFQEAARMLRYQFFQRVAESAGLVCVAVAHQADDQAETVLLNLFRGSGLEGLAAMAPMRVLAEGHHQQLIRPLLGVSKRDLMTYAQQEGIAWREDASNMSATYRRNAVRQQMLPIAEQIFGPGIPHTLARTAAIVRAYLDQDLSPQAGMLEGVGESFAEGGGRLDLQALEQMPVVWRTRLYLDALQRWLPEAPRNKAVADQIEALLGAQVGRRMSFSAGTVWRERTGLYFIPATRSTVLDPAAVFQLTAFGQPVQVPGGCLLLSRVPGAVAQGFPDDAHTILVDEALLRLPLEVRRWQSGDRMTPMGMQGTKQVSDLLTDEKVPSHRRSEVLVMRCAGTILWVVGVRRASGLKVRAESTSVAKIEFLPDCPS